MKIQIGLYIAVQIIYGLADSIIKNSPMLEITPTAELNKAIKKRDDRVQDLVGKTSNPDIQDILGKKEI